MGLIKALANSIGGVMADQWKEYFYCESMPEDVIVTKGVKKTSKRSSNKKGSDNIISNGSVIAVNEGQCMMIVEQGKVVDICSEPGEYVYDTSTEPSLFSFGLSDGIQEIFEAIGKRFAFGGEPANDQRVYYFNTKELIGNKYGTPGPIPFRVVDRNIGLDVDISIRCFGEYSYRITNPILFYANVCGNVQREYTRESIDSQLKSELMTALQPAFAKISEMGIRYSALPGHTTEIADALNSVLSAKWKDLRGIEIVSFGVSSVKASEEDEAMIKELQRNATFRDPNMAAAHLVNAQAAAMQSAAANGTAGPAMAFMNMGMAGNAGGANIQNLFTMGQQAVQNSGAAMGQQVQNNGAAMGQQVQNSGAAMNPQAAQNSSAAMNSQAAQNAAAPWTCSCGASNTSRFCTECGSPKPAPVQGWTCSCGAVNKGKFCPECGSPKPVEAPLYKCDKCGWEPADPSKPPRFCPECGDPFNTEDIL